MSTYFIVDSCAVTPLPTSAISTTTTAITTITPTAGDKVIVCEQHELVLQCPYGTIKITEANYGRTNAQDCPGSQTSNINCINTGTKAVLADRCDGLTSCSIYANNSYFTDECQGTSKYLEVDYTCRKFWC